MHILLMGVWCLLPPDATAAPPSAIVPATVAYERSRDLSGCDWWEENWKADDFHPDRMKVEVSATTVRLGQHTYSIKGSSNRRAFGTILNNCSNKNVSHIEVGVQYKNWQLLKGVSIWAFPVTIASFGGLVVKNIENRIYLDSLLKGLAEHTETAAVSDERKYQSWLSACERLHTKGEFSDVDRYWSFGECSKLTVAMASFNRPWLRVAGYKSVSSANFKRDWARSAIAACSSEPTIDDGDLLNAFETPCRALLKPGPDWLSIPGVALPDTETVMQQLSAHRYRAEDAVAAHLTAGRLGEAEALARVLETARAQLPHRGNSERQQNVANCFELRSAWRRLIDDEMPGHSVAEYAKFHPILNYMATKDVCGEHISSLVSEYNEFSKKAGELTHLVDQAKRSVFAGNYICSHLGGDRTVLSLQADSAMNVQSHDGSAIGQWFLDGDTITIQYYSASGGLASIRGHSVEYSVEDRDLVFRHYGTVRTRCRK